MKIFNLDMVYEHYNNESIREGIRSSLRESGFKFYGINERQYRALVNKSYIISRDDKDKANKIIGRYSPGYNTREEVCRDLYSSTFIGKRIGNIAGFLGGSLGTYAIMSGDGTLESLGNGVIAGLTGLVIGKISGEIGKRIGFKKGLGEIQNKRY